MAAETSSERTNDWTSPDDLAAQVERLWQRGRLLSKRFAGESLFPLTLRLKRPSAQDLTNRFDDVRCWIRELDAASRQRRGFGYDIVSEEINHRQLGRNQIPTGIVVATEHDALALIGRQAEAEIFDTLARETVARFPALRTWIARKPLAIVAHAAEWSRALAVLDWFVAHPCSGFYLRQLDIAGVDTKFIETRRGLLAELLDQLLPPTSSDQVAPSFEHRFGLRGRPALVRLRVLDSSLKIGGLSDVTCPVEQLALLDLPVARIFITENEINGLAFPDMAGSIVLFKLGYALDLLSQISWFGDRHIHYWGDIDTHGFAMLDRLRAIFPKAKSLLMDHETLLAHKTLWVREDVPYTGSLARLNEQEQALYDDLRQNTLGNGVRLEQERIPFSRLQRALGS